MPIHKKYNNHLDTITSLIILLSLLTQIQGALKTSETQISSSRHASRTTICEYSDIIYTQADISKAKSLIGTYNYFSTSEIENLIYDKNIFQIKTQMIILTAPHIITFIVAMILWLPLCCCCTWPEKHPVCRKCRKEEKDVYHRCELKWTSYFTIFFYVIVVVGGILGIMTGIHVIRYFNDVGCKFISFGDDLLYGRLSPTVQDRFFTGLTPYQSNVNSFKTNFNTIWTQISSSLTTAGNVRTSQATYQIFVDSTYTNYVDIHYDSAFKDTNGTSFLNISSQFKDMHLGPTNDQTKILGSMYTTTSGIFSQINAALDPMIAAWGRLSTTTQSGVTTQMTTTQTLITTLSGKINDYIDAIFKLFNNKQSYNQGILGLQLLFGLFLGLSILGLIASILIAFCSVVRARLIMYFTCIGMYFLSIICFVLLILLSILGPNLSQVCSYVDTKFATSSGTKDFFTRLGFTQMADLVDNCMTDGTGWIINDVSPTFNSSFADLVLITKNTQLFNSIIPSYSTSNINAPITAGADRVTKIIDAKILEINDTNALNYIDALRLNALPTTNCDNTNVNADSWLPSYDLYSCSGGKAQNGACLNLAVFSTCASGCYEIMNELATPAGDIGYSTNLATRYGGSTCTYYNYIKDIHEQWNVPRKNKLNTVTTSITTIQSLATTYDTNFKDVQSDLSGFKNILQANYRLQTNVTAGAFNGMDCRVIGQSIIDARNSLCVGLLSSINQNFLVFILLSYGTLMVACCATCTGVRHFKHLQKMSIHTGYKGVPVSISSQRFFQKSA